MSRWRCPVEPALALSRRRDAGYVFYELTRAFAPSAESDRWKDRGLQGDKVFMVKRCPNAPVPRMGITATLRPYTSFANSTSRERSHLGLRKPTFERDVLRCGLCPEPQHTCLGIIEVNSACNMDCPLLLSEIWAGVLALTLGRSRTDARRLRETEGKPKSSSSRAGRPTIHPQISSNSSGQPSSREFPS